MSFNARLEKSLAGGLEGMRAGLFPGTRACGLYCISLVGQRRKSCHQGNGRALKGLVHGFGRQFVWFGPGQKSLKLIEPQFLLL